MFRNNLFSFLKNHPRFVWQLRSFKRRHKLVNFSSPKDLYDYIAYSAVNFDKRWISLADKYEVRKSIAKIIGESYLNELYAVCDNVSELDVDSYPNSFVIKTTNGCATNMIIKNKSKENWDKNKLTLEKWLGYPYGELTGQPHYTYIKPRIIVEKYLEEKGKQSVTDYKFFCIDGEPILTYVLSDRKKNSHQFTIGAYDMEWNFLPQYLSDRHPHSKTDRPISFDEMKNIVKKLANPFKFVRIDLYEINGKPLFGEYTFTPGFDLFSDLALNRLFNVLQH